MPNLRHPIRFALFALVACVLFAATPRASTSYMRLPSQATRQRRSRRATPRPTPTPSRTSRPAATPRASNTPAPAQNPPPAPRPKPTPAAVEEDDEVIDVVSKLVVVPVSVTDARGEAVRGLAAADFRVAERGREQQIERLGDPEEIPLDIALLIDISGSVNERFGFEREAAGRFLRQVLRAADRATVFTIGGESKRVGERGEVNVALKNLALVEPTRGMTAFFDTVADAAKFLASTSPPRTRRVIVCISDGDDRFSDRFTTSAATIPELQRAEVTFYAINPGGNSLRLNVLAVRGQAELVRLTNATGGAAFVPAVAEDLDKIFRQIAAELRSQYLLQYYSTNDAAPGTFLPILVSTPKRAGLRVRARQGYFTGAPSVPATNK